ncbi:MAG: hypothetical protein SFX72_22900 [Isosphaeraceae bacterium]|nr:hypothetical protein [Isosphaeraceae bacterium]
MRRSSLALFVSFVFVGFGLTALSGCGEEPTEIKQAPITKEMEDQAEASSKFMEEEAKSAKKAPAK